MNELPVSKMIKAALVIAVCVVAVCFLIPYYNVWQQEMSGRAELAKAEQNRKIKIEEARANLEAEKLNAQAEIERAKGAAEAIRIAILVRFVVDIKHSDNLKTPVEVCHGCRGNNQSVILACAFEIFPITFDACL